MDVVRKQLSNRLDRSLNAICLPGLCSQLPLQIKFYWKEQKKKTTSPISSRGLSSTDRVLQNGRVNLPELTFSFLDPQIPVPLPHPNPNRPAKELGLPTHPLGDQGTPPPSVCRGGRGGGDLPS